MKDHYWDNDELIELKSFIIDIISNNSNDDISDSDEYVDFMEELTVVYTQTANYKILGDTVFKDSLFTDVMLVSHIGLCIKISY